MTPSNELSACYECLDLHIGATREEVEAAYFQIRGQLICAGQREELAAVKNARDRIKRHLRETEAIASKNETDAIAQTLPTSQKPSTLYQGDRNYNSAASPTANIAAALACINIIAKVSLRKQILHIGVVVDSSVSQQKIIAEIYDLLSEINLENYDLSKTTTVRVYGLDANNKVLWKKTFPLPSLRLSTDDTDLYSFNNRFSNAFIFPGLLLVAIALNAISATKRLLFGITIWIHECGHATIAWLSGYRALPLPFGWTSISLEKSLFVYIGVLFLLGLMFYSGKKENRRWPMVLAIALALIQFYITWLISPGTFQMLFSFGGIGGEFYLSTLLIVSFYFPLPTKFRWDFYRYPTVLFAGFTFFGSLWQWRQIKSGLQAIPWGTMLGGQGDAGGDMNRLVSHGWSDQQIVDSYNSIGSICLIAIISIYIFLFLKQKNYLFLYSLWQQWQSQQHTHPTK